MDHSQHASLNKSTLKILQWNCHSVINKIDISFPLLSEFDVLALSETWLTEKNHISIGDFTILRADSQVNKSGGLLIALRKSIQYTLIKDIPNINKKLESMGVTLHLKEFDLSILSIYRHPNDSISLKEYESLFNFCKLFPNSIGRF